MKSIRRYYKVLIVVLCIVVAIGLVVVTITTKNKEIQDEGNDRSYRQVSYQDQDYTYNSSIVSFAILGIDSEEGKGQADFIDIVLLDRQQKEISVLAIPRDTMCDIRVFDLQKNDLGWQNQHLNLAYSYGSTSEEGSMYTMQAVSRLLNDVPIVNYLTMNVNLISEVHDIVGDITITLPSDLSSVNPNWKKGSQITVNSSNVEQFLRYRDSDESFSNNDRMANQKAYIEAYVAKLREMLDNDYEETFNKVYQVSQSMYTNVSYEDISNYVEMIQSFEFKDDFYHIVEGENVEGYLHDEFIVDDKKLKQLVISLFYKEGK